MGHDDYSPPDDDTEKSLLQKAVRRGYVDVVEKTAYFLLNKGREKWLRDRLFVVAYEECWPIALDLNLNDIVGEYKRIALSVKNKNAWGLSELARDYNSNHKILQSVDYKYRQAIIEVANGLKSPTNFWDGLINSSDPLLKKKISAVQNALPRAKFDFDKAMMFAAAYLLTHEPLPIVKTAKPVADAEFPYWVAFDKHNYSGRLILDRVAEKTDIMLGTLYKFVFYGFGLVFNECDEAPFFNELIKSKKSLFKDLITRRDEIRDAIILESKNDVEYLRKEIETPPKGPEMGQLSFF